MAKSSETGHVKNVANFKTLTTYIEGFGEVYKPSKAADQLPAIKTLLAAAEAHTKQLTDVKPAYTTAVDNQEAGFAPLNKLATRVGSAYAYVAETEGHTHTVKSLIVAIRGEGGKPVSGQKKADAAADGSDDKEEESRSTSQLSYDKRQQNFEEVVQTVAANTQYNPAEEDLKVAALQSTSNNLKALTEAVDKAFVPVFKKRQQRDKTLYTQPNNLYDTVESIKKYLKSVYGPSSPEMKLVNGLAFRKPEKYKSK